MERQKCTEISNVEYCADIEANPFFTCDNWKKSCLEIVLSFEISGTKI